MNISILCSSPEHPVNSYLKRWIQEKSKQHNIKLNRRKKDLIKGDLLFLISCNEIIKKEERKKFKKTLLIHASDLPQGRGWSPHVWEIIKGKSELTVTLLEAEDEVDSGAVWKKEKIAILPHELYLEINKKLFDTEIKLMNFAVNSFHDIQPSEQSNDIAPTYYPKRYPEDSQIDPYKSIYEQFNLLRVCDQNRFPAFFHLHGYRFTLKMEKTDI